MKKSIVIILIALTLAAAVQLSVCAEYIHGYFRYTVKDESVTITAYNGTETTVTVPSMIGGNPVNVIAKGAFANNTYVKTVYLPDTVMTVESGAFGQDQKVVYGSPALKGDANGDGSVNNKDVVFLFRYVTSISPAYSASYDMNSDGLVNNKDVVMLFKSISG